MTKINSNYTLTTQVFETNISKIIADRSNSKYNQTHKALFNCQKKIDSLLKNIESTDFTNADNFYFVQVLTRVIVEHFIVGHYIWTKARIDKKDTVGTEFYTHYRLSELLKRENYDLGIEGIEKNIKKHATFENLQKRLEDAPQPISQKDVEDIHRQGNQFDIKTILQYLLNTVPEDDHFKNFHKLLSQFLRIYNNLSSYVHGGPSAEFEAYEDEKVDKIKVAENDIHYGKMASYTLKEHIMMLFCEERPEYLEMLQPIMDLKKSP